MFRTGESISYYAVTIDTFKRKFLPIRWQAKGLFQLHTGWQVSSRALPEGLAKNGPRNSSASQNLRPIRNCDPLRRFSENLSRLCLLASSHVKFFVTMDEYDNDRYLKSLQGPRVDLGDLTRHVLGGGGFALLHRLGQMCKK